jgi:hypothetical protein
MAWCEVCYFGITREKRIGERQQAQLLWVQPKAEAVTRRSLTAKQRPASA